ncbi:MAG TPA: hypothetical protein VMF66_12905 [Candidatus Acidoferrum sp.]|nr:hypothetical protein [Candidatus Acidoferrum sp.]
MKAKNKKHSKSRKSLKAAKKLEAQKPLLTYNLSGTYVSGHTLSGGGGGTPSGGN